MPNSHLNPTRSSLSLQLENGSFLTSDTCIDQIQLDDLVAPTHDCSCFKLPPIRLKTRKLHHRHKDSQFSEKLDSIYSRSSLPNNQIAINTSTGKPQQQPQSIYQLNELNDDTTQQLCQQNATNKLSISSIKLEVPVLPFANQKQDNTQQINQNKLQWAVKHLYKKHDWKIIGTHKKHTEQLKHLCRQILWNHAIIVASDQPKIMKIIARCSLLSSLWQIFIHCYIRSLRIITPIDCAAITAVLPCFLYLLCWIIVHRRFCALRVVLKRIINKPTVGQMACFYFALGITVFMDMSCRKSKRIIRAIQPLCALPICIGKFQLSFDFVFSLDILFLIPISLACFISFKNNKLIEYFLSDVYELFWMKRILTMSSVQISSLILITMACLLNAFPTSWQKHIAKMLKKNRSPKSQPTTNKRSISLIQRNKTSMVIPSSGSTPMSSIQRSSIINVNPINLNTSYNNNNNSSIRPLSAGSIRHGSIIHSLKTKI
ncbi:hypothetical protein Smp_153030 [Schistosoma mansoni]|uniref:hypothetical protein n=1 Tax=Schistosoma mansoni TaxID=6183 RepID=UPI00022DBF47|nr:hypothetical protein Smp_153030 [Schistosoma mansoni]|eukprot:XP_018653588.1 hypothetical protein Smp_153030 [Schistosoma mansoni]